MEEGELIEGHLRAKPGETVYTPSEDKIRDLFRIPFFKSLSVAETEKLLSICRFLTFDAEETVVAMGDDDNSVYIIGRGSVRIEKRDESSDKRIHLMRLSRGDHFGETSLFSSKSRSYLVDVIAEEHTLLIELDRRELLNFFGENHRSSVKLLLYFMKSINDRLEEVSEMYTDIQSRNIDIRTRFGNGHYDQGQGTDSP